MKRILAGIGIAVLSMTVISPIVGYADENNISMVSVDTTDSIDWDYPDFVYTDEWNVMLYSEKKAYCEMPEKYLERCSTYELAGYVLEYPLLSRLFIYDSMDMGVERLLESSNICKEFSKREDNVEVLLRRYDELDVQYEMLNCGATGNPWRESGYMKEVFIQSYFSYKYDELTEEEKDELIQIYEEKGAEKVGHCDEYTTEITFQNTILAKDVLAGFDVSEVLLSRTLSVAATSGFTATSTEYVKLDNGATCEVGVYTKYGVSVGCYHYISGNYSSSVVAEINADYDEGHPTWTRIYGASKKYNCHSFAWIAKLPSNTWWINNPDAYAASSGFTYVGMNGGAQEGDIIIINGSMALSDGFGGTTKAVHSVVVTEGASERHSIKTRSKFGQYGVYEAYLYEVIDEYADAGAVSYKVYRPN